MIYIYVSILGAFFLLLVLSRREEEKGVFRKMAAYVLRRKQEIGQRFASKKRGWKKELWRRRLGDKLKTLQPGLTVPKQVKEYYLSQYSMVLMVVCLGDQIGRAHV